MRIFTNPGSNLPRAALEKYGVVLTPQQIVAGGVSYDTRKPIPLAQVDAWTREPGEYPYVIGTTAPEMASLLVEHLAHDPEILVVTTSKKIIKTYDAAIAAVKTIEASPKLAHAKIRVIDSGVTDAGAGLLVHVAGEEMRKGKSFADVCAAVEKAKGVVRFFAYIHKLEWSVRGGRLGWMRGWLANALEIRPIVTFVDGETTAAAKVKLSDDRMRKLADLATEGLAGRKVWLAIGHGGAPTEATEVERLVRERCHVTFAYALPTSPSIYLHSGPGGVAVAILPV